MPRKMVKIDWPALDWTKSNAKLARELGVSGEYVRQHRQALFPPKALRKPREVVLEATARATAKKYVVPWTVANQWHLEAGKTAKPGRPRYSLPEGFVPTTITADAKRLGVCENTLWQKMKNQGITPGPGRGPDGTTNK